MYVCMYSGTSHFGTNPLSFAERLSSSHRLKINHYYGRGVMKGVLYLGGCPFLGGSFIGGSSVCIYVCVCMCMCMCVCVCITVCMTALGIANNTAV